MNKRAETTEAWALVDDANKIIAMAIWADYDDACSASYALGGDSTRVIRVLISPAPVTSQKDRADG